MLLILYKYIFVLIIDLDAWIDIINDVLNSNPLIFKSGNEIFHQSGNKYIYVTLCFSRKFIIY